MTDIHLPILCSEISGLCEAIGEYRVEVLFTHVFNLIKIGPQYSFCRNQLNFQLL